MHNIKVSVIQSDLIWEDAQKNRSSFEKKIDKLPKETNLVILPEMFTTGFSMKSKELAEEINSSLTLDWMRQIAKSKNILLIGSFIVKDKTNYYNRLVAMNPDGQHDFYDKRHLFRMGGEHEHFAAGNERIIIEYMNWRICPLVCYDLRFPVWSRNKNDYDILIYIANWPESRRDVYKTLLKARAIENQSYVIGVNRIGVDGLNLSYSGDSRIISPKGQIMAKCKKHIEKSITTELSSNELNDFKAKFPVALDADSFTIH